MGGNPSCSSIPGDSSRKRAEKIASLVKEQIYGAVEESSIIIFLLDAADGLLPEDFEIASILRRYNKPVFYVVNKVDSQKREADAADFYRLGVEKLYSVSAAHGLGVGDLLEDIGRIAGAGPEEEAVRGIKIAVVGRPNTGKSSLVNRLLGSDRMIVSDMPGTTRDAIDSIIQFQGKTFTMIDTAGLRKKSRISEKVEEYSVASALRSIERSDVVNLVIDGQIGIGHQDGTIAHFIVSEGKGIGIVVNKRDLMDPGATEDAYRRMVLERLPHADFAPVIFTSALTGEGVEQILDADTAVYGHLTKRISTPKLNKAFEEFTRKAEPPGRGREAGEDFLCEPAQFDAPHLYPLLELPGPHSGALQEISGERAEGKIRLQGRAHKAPFQEKMKRRAET